MSKRKIVARPVNAITSYILLFRRKHYDKTRSVAVIVGSLRKESINRKVARVLADWRLLL